MRTGCLVLTKFKVLGKVEDGREWGVGEGDGRETDRKRERFSFIVI